MSRRTVRRIVLTVGVLAVVIVANVAIYEYGHRAAAPEVLPPATVPPAVGLCSAQLSYAANGNASPLFCSNRHINRLAWEYFAKATPRVMALSQRASPGDVGSAVSNDMTNSTGTIECSAFQLAYVYYGWTFGVNPTSGTLEGCRFP